MFQKIRNKNEGFTIIEVMIVLAIGALIMVVVLIAVPQLQRNQRNSARRDVLGRIKAELDNFAGNNNGNYPTETNDATVGFTGGFPTRYLGCNTAASPWTCTVNINDPRSGNPPVFNNAATVPTMITAAGFNNGAANINYNLGAVCNGEAPNGAGSNRNYAIAIALEGGAAYCLDNR